MTKTGHRGTSSGGVAFDRLEGGGGDRDADHGLLIQGERPHSGFVEPASGRGRGRGDAALALPEGAGGFPESGTPSPLTRLSGRQST
jgi:hypothetical protein